jgi:hypothetical protein
MNALKRIAVLLLVVALLLVGLCVVSFVPLRKEVGAALRANETQVAQRHDYKLHTTPLPADTVLDLCSALGITASFPKCRGGIDVYAPEFFAPIKTYFTNVGSEKKTYEFVQEKLGRYQVRCEEPSSDGNYRCFYDLRGDGIYLLAFYFDKHGHYFEIFADVDLS